MARRATSSSRSTTSSRKRRSQTPKQALAQQLGRAIALLLVLGLVLLLNRYCGLESESFGPNAKLVAIDGDTLRASNGDEYRIFGIDAPELHQTCTDAKGKDWDCGVQARTLLRKLIKSGEVSCVEKATDKYGRNVAQCRSADVPDIGESMVREGFAIDLGRQTGNAYAGAESEARAAGRGIWAGAFQKPGAWRQDHPRTN
ncbi:MAG: thermonuclease family protein [Methyloceanibacter sp.]|uniref:thermonuclease family protein n=1 Tax=Methyloceanibacter sp. TaxID=1965321 RepID=UPI001D23927D|nr:thermonuclease family protein [Methyloceanibacter sp.]MCB1443478.1 thermonuclease family protein [Methyloceanibacter sp.]